jgi:hypothetical protein
MSCIENTREDIRIAFGEMLINSKPKWFIRTGDNATIQLSSIGIAANRSGKVGILVNEINSRFKSRVANVISQNNNIFIDPSNDLITKYDTVKKRVLQTDLSPKFDNKYSKPIEQLKLIQLPEINKRIASAKVNKNTVLVNSLEKRRQELEDRIKELEDKASFQKVINSANKDLEQVKELLTQDDIKESDILYTQKILNFWRDSETINDILDVFDIYEKNTNYDLYKDIKDRANELYDVNWLEVYNKGIIQILEDNLNKDLSSLSSDQKLELINNLKEINIGEAFLLDSSRNANLIIQAADKINKKASVKAEMESAEILSKYEKHIKALSKEFGSPEKAYEYLIQLNEDGTKTGNLVFRYSQKYFNTMRKAKIGKDKSKLREFYRKNTIHVEYKYLFPEIFKEFYGGDIDTDNVTAKEHIKALKDTLGEKGYEEYFEIFKAKIERFKQAYDEIKLSIEEQYKDDDTSIEREINSWLIANSPFYYSNLIKGNVYKTADQFNKFRGYEYVVNLPLREINGKATGYYDSNYEKVESNEILYSFYKDIIDDLNEFKSFYPTQITDGLQINNLPSISKSIFENITSKNAKTITKDFWNNVLTSISSPEFLKDASNRVNPITNQVERRLPTFMITNKLSPEQKSYDLIKVVQAAAMSSLTYKHKAYVEDSLNLIKIAVQNANKAEYNKDGTYKRDSLGEVLSTKGGLENISKQFEYLYDSFYSKTKDDTLSNKKIKTKEAEEIEEQIKKIKDDYDTNIISLEEYETKKAELENELALTTRNLSWTKLIEALPKYIHLKSLGWNVYSALNNVGFGLVSNFTHSAGGEDFTTTQYLTSVKDMMTLLGSDVDKLKPGKARKIEALMNAYNVLSENTEDMYESSKNRFTKKQLSKLLPHEISRRAEYFNQGSMFVAMLRNKMIEIGDINISLYDLYNDEGLINEDKLKELGATDEQVKKIKGAWNGIGEEKLKFKLKIDAIKKTIHGNYDPNSKVLIKRTLPGRVALMFRSWIAEGVNARWGGLKYDDNLERDTLGRYRSFSPVFKEVVKAYKEDRTIELSDLDKANLKKSVADALVLSLVLASLAMIKSLKEDDDEEENKALFNTLINHLNRIFDDILFFVWPDSFFDIVKDPIPATKGIIDLTKWFTSMYIYLIDEDRDVIKRGKYAGESQLERNTKKVIPFVSSIKTLENVMEQDISQDSKSLFTITKEALDDNPTKPKKKKKSKSKD